MYALRSYDLTEPADIAVNQRSEISARQRAAFNEVARAANRTALILNAVIAALFACPVYQIWQSADNLTNKAGLTLAAVVVVSIIIVAPFLSERSKVIKFRKDLQTGSIAQAEGEMRWRWGRTVAQTADRELQSIFGPLTLPPGYYRFYYLSHSGGILSAEKIDHPH